MAKNEVVLLPAAYSDLDEIFDYILTDNPLAANRILQDILKSLSRLEYHPYSGSPLVERPLNKFHFRMVVISPYIAFNRVIDNKVFVYRILHGARHYSHLLKKMMD